MGQITCGEIFCDLCGDCIYCYGDDPCYENDESYHQYKEPEDEEEVSEPNVIDEAHIERQRTFSRNTFGPSRGVDGVIDHIRKELQEIEDEPHDLEEWVDVIILGIDGAWRAGYEPQAIIDAIVAKQLKNELREWPDWRTVPAGKAIEHIR
jgi:hypothetical protein